MTYKQKSLYTEIKMLAEAGYCPDKLRENYIELIDFANQVAKQSCNLIEPEKCIPCQCVTLLRKIGEAEG